MLAPSVGTGNKYEAYRQKTGVISVAPSVAPGFGGVFVQGQF
jgi:hypothetical protein